LKMRARAVKWLRAGEGACVVMAVCLIQTLLATMEIRWVLLAHAVQTIRAVVVLLFVAAVIRQRAAAEGSVPRAELSEAALVFIEACPHV
jgi:hypothetical protein